LESQSIDRSNRWINAIAPTPQSEVQILHRSSKEETMPNLIANYSTRRKGVQSNRPIQLQTSTEHNKPRTQMIAVHPHDVKDMA
jgi:hypothetical protein